ncbi:MAG: hypothetical protein C0425_01840 [Chlorobiaceae bacterium]|nr:hypothetical protein [Chlorobiaceae bacterium]MBA4309060.1 hypothetical protein [Chlorobiaceae bacterium]
MPDHFHGIVFIVGADLRVCPKIKEETKTFVSPEMIVSAETEAEAKTNANARQSEEIRGGERVDKVGEPEIELQGEDGNKEGEHVGSPQRDTPQRDTPQRDTPQRDTPQRKSSLSQIIQWFKTMTTNEFLREIKNNNWEPFHGKLWQKNYYERIIRNEIELNKVREYIINNPSRWKSDSKNPYRKK